MFKRFSLHSVTWCCKLYFQLRIAQNVSVTWYYHSCFHLLIAMLNGNVSFYFSVLTIMESRGKKILQFAKKHNKIQEKLRPINAAIESVPQNNVYEEESISNVVEEELVFNAVNILSAPIIIDNVEYPAEECPADGNDVSFSLNVETSDLIEFISNDHDLENITDINDTGQVSHYVDSVQSKPSFDDGDIVEEAVQEAIVEEAVVEENSAIFNGLDHENNSENDRVNLETQVAEVDSVQLMTTIDENIPNEEAANRPKRKRHIEESNDGHDNKTWKRSRTKECRMLGKGYVGFKRQNSKISHDVERGPRTQKPTCNSNKCKISKNRFCSSFTEENRKQIFEHFWKCTWDEKRLYVINMVRKVVKKRETAGTDESRRNFTLEYHLKYANNDSKQVCKTMFLGTLGLNEWMVKNWVDKSDHGLPHKGGQFEDDEEEQVDDPNSGTENIRHRQSRSLDKKKHLNDWIVSLPKMESHYCRNNSKRLYLEGPFNTKQEIYDLYLEKCKIDNVTPFKRNSVMKVFEENRISIFKPRKDQCDTCISYKTKQVTDEEYNKHIIEKNRAREEKEIDKEKAKAGECMVFTVDLQSVNLCPKTMASSLYYCMKLKVYNLTIFDLGRGQCFTYWWNECDGELEASVFASIVIKHIQNICLPLPEKCKKVIFYSDGCGYQNRNNILANALLNFSIEYGLNIEHKYLVKGHSQMECDSAHALIERSVKNKDIYLPSDYVKIAKECKKTKPYYHADLLDHSYFLDYSPKTSQIYKSIRPGKGIGDPQVKDMRDLKYNPELQRIEYKLSFDDDYKELPQRQAKSNITKQKDFKLLYKSQLPLTMSKFEDLQKLKKVLPQDTHAFYDTLPHATKFVTKEKNI